MTDQAMAPQTMTSQSNNDSTIFRVGLSADFCDDRGQLVFPDIGLSLFAGVPRLLHGFLSGYQAEYSPFQLVDYDVLISLKPKVTAQSLRNITTLCAIGRCGVGYDNVDLDACTEHGIAVYITPGGVVRPVAEAILLFVLALSHRLTIKDRMVRQGSWAESTRRLGREPRDRIVGTIGMGNIATEAVRLLRTLDVARFVAFDPFANPTRAKELGVELVSLEELLSVSDYVLINCPLTPQTRGLIGAKQLAQMKTDAVLINTARGPIVDEGALISALQSGQIAGAALDVFEKEPLSPDSPLANMENVILSSHSIAWTEELFRDMGRIDCQGALAIYYGEVPNHVVNPEVLTRPLFSRQTGKIQGRLVHSGARRMSGLRQRLQSGEVILGQMVLELFTPGIGPMLDACGLDFVIFDMEHGRCDIALLAEMIASCRGSNIVPMARVPDLNFAPLSRALDLGARGVMVPRIETREQAEGVVRQLKYAPEGERGVALGVAHDLYKAGSPDFFQKNQRRNLGHHLA